MGIKAGDRESHSPSIDGFVFPKGGLIKTRHPRYGVPCDIGYPSTWIDQPEQLRAKGSDPERLVRQTILSADEQAAQRGLVFVGELRREPEMVRRYRSAEEAREMGLVFSRWVKNRQYQDVAYYEPRKSLWERMRRWLKRS
jgi:hypothetical protein